MAFVTQSFSASAMENESNDVQLKALLEFLAAQRLTVDVLCFPFLLKSIHWRFAYSMYMVRSFNLSWAYKMLNCW